MKKPTDPIVDEVRRVRREHAARFNFDLQAIFEDVKRSEAESGREYVRFEPRRVAREKPASAASD